MHQTKYFKAFQMAFRDKTLDKSRIRIPSSLSLLIDKFYLFNFVCLDLVEIFHFFQLT